MKFSDVKEKFSGIIRNINGNNELYDEDGYDDYESYSQPEEPVKAYQPSNVASFDQYSAKRNFSVKNYNNEAQKTAQNSTAAHQAKETVVIMTPKSTDDLGIVPKLVRENKILMVSLENAANADEAHDICTFLGAVACSFDGQIEIISNRTIVLGNANVKITNDLKASISENRVFAGMAR